MKNCIWEYHSRFRIQRESGENVTAGMRRQLISEDRMMVDSPGGLGLTVILGDRADERAVDDRFLAYFETGFRPDHYS